MKTTDDLKAAFAGESQANRKYLAWAKQADREGHPGIARLFRAVAAAETIHAHGHLKTLGDIKSTEENLVAAAAGENYEVVSMYPDFIADAQAEGQAAAEKSFTWAWEVEKVHEKMYGAALEQLRKGSEPEGLTYWVCNTCGHTHVGDAPPERCPVCQSKATAYSRID
ncbi:MAG: rubrerythrin family protein [Anaerolineae bacterium]|jgi:rubrerythrin|nr:rubrerythrin family protein [Anaerolineae bacterium]